MPDVGTHRTLEDERRDPDGKARLEHEIECYEIFPAIWPVSFHIGALHIEEDGLGFPVEPALRAIHAERHWHSYVTHVRLRSSASQRDGAASRGAPIAPTAG